MTLKENREVNWLTLQFSLQEYPGQHRPSVTAKRFVSLLFLKYDQCCQFCNYILAFPRGWKVSFFSCPLNIIHPSRPTKSHIVKEDFQTITLWTIPAFTFLIWELRDSSYGIINTAYHQIPETEHAVYFLSILQRACYRNCNIEMF